MNTNHPDDRIAPAQDEHDNTAPLPGALADALSALRQDQRPQRDLWAGIECRLPSPVRVPVDDAPDYRLPAPLAMLRADQAPRRDLWTGIESRIHLQRWRRLRAPLAAASGLAASLVIVLGLQVYRGHEVNLATSSPTAAAQTPLRASAEVIAAMQEPVVRDSAFRSVSTQPLAPETRALVRANLKIVSSAETQLRRALESDPDGAYLKSLLATAQQQKQDLRTALATRR